MADYYELNTIRKDQNGKDINTRIGAAFPFKNGEGFVLKFNALPMPRVDDQGQMECVVMMGKPYEKKEGG